MEVLLTREEFRNSVFKRDNYKCVICGDDAKDAHHIMERRLFSDFGYYIDNGASLCQKCHLMAESTELSCDTIRGAAGITNKIIPKHLYQDQDYDKWGNPILPNGSRLIGELFYDESVQKILTPVLSLFTNKIKYPRTHHLPWSESINPDDEFLYNLKGFRDKQVVVTVKLDGEQTTMYKDYIHARSIDSGNHPSRNRVKAIHGNISYNIPENWRVCGENVYAMHSIHYHNLEDYFYVFSIWNEKNECLSWDDTKEWTELLGLKTVPVLYEGLWDEDIIKSLYSPTYNNDEMEGYVVRIRDGFPAHKHREFVGKFVRKNHVQTAPHGWLRLQIVPNELKNL